MGSDVRSFALRFGGITRRTALAGIAAAVLLTGVGAGSAHAEPPMWVVKDQDSTIYLFGTVHLLDPNIKWATPRVEGALDEATQLWEEIPMPSSIQEAQAQMAPAMLPRAVSPDQPLSSLLSDEEKAELERALARTPRPEQLGKVLEHMKPWFAIVNLGTSPLINAGFEPGAGADIVLSRLAREQGDEVLGFETLEQQLDMMSGWTEDQQLAALRALLAVPDEEFKARIAGAVAAFRAWMGGDTTPAEAIIDDWRTGRDELRSKIMPYDVFLANRNESWAGQIKTLLAGKGVVFVAVGAGHLVGPDSVQARLATRGIEAERY
jgi:uncharacterized protein YbaP (TraB family)